METSALNNPAKDLSSAQKAALKVMDTAKLREQTGSRFAKVIPSFQYNPAPKPMSRRDKHRFFQKAKS